jgi:hypothetical protein
LARRRATFHFILVRDRHSGAPVLELDVHLDYPVGAADLDKHAAGLGTALTTALNPG